VNLSMTIRSAVVLAVLLAGAACTKRDPDRGTSIAKAASPPATTPAKPPPTRPPAEPWSPERVRQFVLDTDRALLAKRGEVAEKSLDAKTIGECYGGPAYDLAPASDLLPVLRARLTGRAMACYLASYFGCRLGDRIASAGLSLNVPVARAFAEGKAQILEQTADRIVADVPEVEFNAAPSGKLDKGQVRDRTEFGLKSRYTMIRDAGGTWRISDRVPSYPEWECREK
jgi:hypothetical protein